VIAADREHVAERGVELELDPEPDLSGIAVQDADALAQAIHEEACPSHRERLRREDRAVVEGRGTVRELECADVVLLRVRREQRGRLAVDAEREPREELGVVVVEPEWRGRAQGEAPIVIGHEDEAVLLHGDAHQRSTRARLCSSNAAA